MLPYVTSKCLLKAVIFRYCFSKAFEALGKAYIDIELKGKAENSVIR
jgi:hypothetical protein